MAGLLEEDEAAFVRQLLNRVERSNENKFINGRYFEPITLTHKSENLDKSSSIAHRIATFISLPFFDLGDLNPIEHNRDHRAHLPRTLLQARYRFDTTFDRDKAQVATKALQSSPFQCIKLPQLWALMINQSWSDLLSPLRSQLKTNRTADHVCQLRCTGSSTTNCQVVCTYAIIESNEDLADQICQPVKQRIFSSRRQLSIMVCKNPFVLKIKRLCLAD